VLLAPPATSRQEAVERTVATYRVIGSPAYELDEPELRERAGLSYDRAYDPAGVSRQLVAILASGDRTERLRNISVPTLVIHGDRDPLVDVSGGRATAAAIPGADLMVVEGMGHNLPRELWPAITERIAALVERGEESYAAAAS
jgi:pimeloyl-ACP methyl ester carboxylesterase